MRMAYLRKQEITIKTAVMITPLVKTDRCIHLHNAISARFSGKFIMVPTTESPMTSYQAILLPKYFTLDIHWQGI